MNLKPSPQTSQARPLRIAFFAVKNIDRGGGIEKYTKELGSRLVRRGHEVTVFSMTNYGMVPSDCLGMKLVPVASLRHSALEKLSASFCATLAILRCRKQFDIVHCQSIAAGCFAPLLRLGGLSCLLQMHGVEWQRSRWNHVEKWCLRFLEWIAIHSSHANTAVSQDQCAYFNARCSRKFEFIPSGADAYEPFPPLEIKQFGLLKNNYILFASRLVPEKGAHDLIDAFRMLDTDKKLIIAGSAHGMDDYIESLRERAGDDPRVIFTGFVEGRLLAELFENAGLYVLPSSIEGLSISLLEAMSCGICCLASDIPPNREALAETGAFFKCGNIKELAVRMEELLRDEGLRKHYGEKAQARVSEVYSWDGIASRFDALYQRVMARMDEL